MFKFFKKRIPEVITLPGYETIISNIVYSPAVKEASLERNVLLLCRFHEPFLEEVTNHLARKADYFPDLASALTKGERMSLTKLEYWLYHLPAKVIDQLRENKLQQELRQAMPFSVCEGNTYARILLGTISSQDLQKGRVVENIRDYHRWYQRHMGIDWKINIVMKDGRLLPHKDLDFLIKHGASKSRSLQVIPENDYNILLPAIAESVYEGLYCQEQVHKLLDVSAERLEEKTVTTLHSLYYFLVKRGDIKSVVKAAINKSSKPPYFVKEKKGKPS